VGKRKNSGVDNEEEVLESGEFEGLESEALEVDPLAEDTSLTLKTLPKQESKPKTRRSRRKKTPQVEEVFEEAPGEDTAVGLLASEAGEPAQPVVVPPVAAVAPVAPLIDFMASAPPASVTGMDAIAKQWMQVRDLSQTVGFQLQGVASTLQDLQKHYADALQELAKAVPAKKSPVNRITAAIAGFAIVLSFISLNLSQSARQATLTGALANVPAATAVADIAPIPKKSAPPSGAPSFLSGKPAPSARREVVIRSLKKEVARSHDSKKSKR
jgi:hypothetical protein